MVSNKTIGMNPLKTSTFSNLEVKNQPKYFEETFLWTLFLLNLESQKLEHFFPPRLEHHTRHYYIGVKYL